MGEGVVELPTVSPLLSVGGTSVGHILKSSNLPRCVWCDEGSAFPPGAQDMATEIRSFMGFFISLTDCCDRATCDTTVLPQGLHPAMVAGSRWVLEIVTIAGSPYIKGVTLFLTLSLSHTPLKALALLQPPFSRSSRCLSFASTVASPPSLSPV